MCVGSQLAVRARFWGRGQMTPLNTHTHTHTHTHGKQLVGRPAPVSGSVQAEHPLALDEQETVCVCKHGRTKQPLMENTRTHTHTHTHSAGSPELKQQAGYQSPAVGPGARCGSLTDPQTESHSRPDVSNGDRDLTPRRRG